MVSVPWTHRSGEDRAESSPPQLPALAPVAASAGPRCIPEPGMILDQGLRDASGDRERLVCPGDPPTALVFASRARG